MRFFYDGRSRLLICTSQPRSWIREVIHWRSAWERLSCNDILAMQRKGRTHPPPSLWAWSHSRPAALPLSPCCNPTLKHATQTHTHTIRAHNTTEEQPHVFPCHGNPIQEEPPQCFPTPGERSADWRLAFGLSCLWFSLPLKDFFFVFPWVDMCSAKTQPEKFRAEHFGRTAASQTWAAWVQARSRAIRKKWFVMFAGRWNPGWIFQRGGSSHVWCVFENIQIIYWFKLRPTYF